jgi:RimJ/RimL family protein N-acetyltransferase
MGSSSDLRFGDDFREEVTLKDGTRVVLRMVRASDRERLRRGFQRMSPESRYFRFFFAKESLSEDELRRLTEVDGVNHVAIGAVLSKGNGDGEGLGIARFFRLHDEPEVAEPAIAVVDDFQGRGLGSLLLRRLGAAAMERGISCFRCEVLADNQRMRRILERASPDAWFARPSGGIVELELRLPQATYEEPGGPGKSTIHDLFSHVASETIAVRLGRRLLEHLTGKKAEG